MFDTFQSSKKPKTESSGQLGELAGKKVVIICTGSISAMYLPPWLAWLETTYINIQFRVVLTQTALKFVGSYAVNTYSQSPFIVDDWNESGARPIHIELSNWADGFIIHPATIDYVSRLANGTCNSPSLLAIQGSDKPIVVAPALPPGYLNSHIWRAHSQVLSERSNIHILQPVTGGSSSSQDLESYPPQPFPAATRTLATALSHITNGEET